MIEKFIEWLKQQVGSIYVWGGQGETEFNEAWIKKMETTDKNAQRAIKLYEKRQDEGKDPIAAYDCSGLIVRFLLDNELIQSDTTSGGLYTLSTKISKDMLTKGDLLFRHNGTSIHHVGVYIGGDMVIHAKGRDVGVVREHIDANGETYWNRYGRLPELSYKSSNYPLLMTYSGATYVNLRDKASAVTGKVLDAVTSGEEVLVLGMDKNGWSDVVKYCPETDTYKRGYCLGKYFK
ncbi:MAG: C40 family peptidase [Clostridia bacterium]|nr:C40 family peptidase [Clostridia bacterium]